eukprot:GDKJ01030694.1.p1 GENE.GDKJ01030694.1~~GDKJ01030694.1.p1  ORF type:complete len:174 (-),score=58.66 GDKJ01030694.1:67-588(-)
MGKLADMAPKFDPNDIKIVTFRQYGGEVCSTAVLAPKIGPLGLNAKKVGEDCAKATAGFKGIKVTVKLAIQNRIPTISIVPTSTALVMEALKEPIRDRKKEKNIKHAGNITFETIIGIARKMREANKSGAKDLAGSVKEILGTCRAVGCSVNKQKPQTIIDSIDAGETEVPAQ